MNDAKRGWKRENSTVFLSTGKKRDIPWMRMNAVQKDFNEKITDKDSMLILEADSEEGIFRHNHLKISLQTESPSYQSSFEGHRSQWGQ